MFVQVVIEDVPEPGNDAVVVVESAVILRVFAQIFEVDGLFVVSNQPLHLRVLPTFAIAVQSSRVRNSQEPN